MDYGVNHGDAQFHWFKIPEALGAEGFLCVVEQVTPDLVFQPPADGHPNGATSVQGVIVLAQDADAARHRYAELPGANGTDGNRVWFTRQFIDVVDEETLAQTFPTASSIRAPALAGFVVSVVDIEATHRLLSDQGVAVHPGPDGELCVGPDDGCGAAVVFRQA